jgi:SAM-dependent methyltransferase
VSADELAEHRKYWDDDVKVRQYRAALAAVVRPGDVVIDLGCGTGLLGLLALAAGAGSVIAIDSGPIIELAKKIATAAGVADHIRYEQKLSSELDLGATLADVVVSDQIGGLAFEPGTFAYNADALARLTKPGARFVPGSFRFMAAPVELEQTWRDTSFWSGQHCGYDLSVAAPFAANSTKWVHATPDDLLSEPVVFGEQAGSVATPVSGQAQCIVTRAGTCHGILGMFEATLAPGVVLSNQPGHPLQMTHRWQTYLPISASHEVTIGDVVCATISFQPETGQIQWNVSAQRDGANTWSSKHASFFGSFISVPDLQSLQIPEAPTPRKHHDLWLATLELIDRGVSKDALFGELAARFGQQLGTQVAIEGFVRKVLSATDHA